MFQILISEPSPEILNAFRAYISFVRHFASFDVNDEMQTFVQEDFVRERSTDQVQIHNLILLKKITTIWSLPF